MLSIVVGGIASLPAEAVVRRISVGLVGTIVVGTLGAFIGEWLFGILRINLVALKFALQRLNQSLRRTPSDGTVCYAKPNRLAPGIVYVRIALRVSPNFAKRKRGYYVRKYHFSSQYGIFKVGI